ncbi:MAG TPA: PTS glucose transporter subunit IIA [Lapidilactobacillus dextrinicus]|uniref:PTS glucose transporter subunit IIA n=1 Tax=Lapidilactobacillus dextrinicus TaxID=51664 RepID=A0A921DVB5_9LACO|nr:PTS glucose transporter subunit IIA [Lapidilactobacillus dextrinicus]
MILAPVTGEYVPLSDVKDDVFSQKLMGDGFGIQPTDQTIYAPVSGKVVSIFKTKHAIGLQTATGLEVLIHLGIDTVELAGQPFELFVSEGQEIMAGDKLATENIAMIKEAAKDPIVLTLITNSATTDSEIVEHLSSQAKVDANSLALIVK